MYFVPSLLAATIKPSVPNLVLHLCHPHIFPVLGPISQNHLKSCILISAELSLIARSPMSMEWGQPGLRHSPASPLAS
jgi:hypothetical protein